jgi:hypothetical protein
MAVVDEQILPLATVLYLLVEGTVTKKTMEILETKETLPDVEVSSHRFVFHPRLSRGQVSLELHHFFLRQGVPLQTARSVVSAFLSSLAVAPRATRNDLSSIVAGCQT